MGVLARVGAGAAAAAVAASAGAAADAGAHGGRHDGPVTAQAALLPPLPPIVVSPIKLPVAPPTRMVIETPAETAPPASTPGDTVTLSGTVVHPADRTVSNVKVEILNPPGTVPPARAAQGAVPTTCLRACASTSSRATRILRWGPVSLRGLAGGDNTVRATAEFAGGAASPLTDTVVVTREAGTPNLWLRAMEITQGQRALFRTNPGPRTGTVSGGSIFDFGILPRIADRPTVIRAYPAVESGDAVPNVTALLYGSRGSSEPLPGSPLRPVGPVTAVAGESLDDQAADAAKTLNFVLPPEWTATYPPTPGLRLTLELNSGSLPPSEIVRECADCRDDADRIAISTNYFQPGPVEMRILPWRAGGTPDLPVETFFTAIPRLFPVAPGRVIVEPFQGQVSGSGCGALDGLLQRVGFGARGFNYAVSNVVTNGCAGIAMVGFPAAAGMAGTGTPGAFDELTAGQELAHNLGLDHAGCAHGEAVFTSCSAFPNPHGGIGTPGFDISTMTAIPPGDPGPDGSGGHAHDVLSYGEDTRPGLPLQWISDRSWSDLRTALLNPQLNPGAAQSRALAGAAVASAAQAPGQRLVVSGRVGPEASARIAGVSERAAPADKPPAAGEYELRALDASGSVVASRRIDGDADTSHVRAGVPFLVSLPSPGRIAEVQVRQGATVLAQRIRSSADPKVQWTDPGAASAAAAVPASGFKRVSWTASDADRDPLRYDVEFSRDGGRTWRPILVGTPALSARIDLGLLPATPRGRFRVVASDGFNASADAAGATIRVPNHRPVAIVGTPTNGAVVPAGSALALQGAGVDVDDGSVPASRLQWSSSRDGALGRGASLGVVRPSIGRHRLTLLAVDRAGDGTRRTITVTVVPGVPDGSAPRILRAARRGRAVRVTFSEDVAGVSARSLRLRAAGRPVSATVRFDAARRTATVVPTRRVAGALTLAAGAPITDLGGLALRPAVRSVR